MFYVLVHDTYVLYTPHAVEIDSSPLTPDLYNVDVLNVHLIAAASGAILISVDSGFERRHKVTR